MICRRLGNPRILVYAPLLQLHGDDGQVDFKIDVGGGYIAHTSSHYIALRLCGVMGNNFIDMAEMQYEDA